MLLFAVVKIPAELTSKAVIPLLTVNSLGIYIPLVSLYPKNKLGLTAQLSSPILMLVYSFYCIC